MKRRINLAPFTLDNLYTNASGCLPRKSGRLLWPCTKSTARFRVARKYLCPWMDRWKRVARGNLPIFRHSVAINLINRTPFSPSSRRSKEAGFFIVHVKFLSFSEILRISEKVSKLEISSLVSPLYIFVGRGMNFNVGANIDGSQLFAEKGTTTCSHSANYLFNYGREEPLFCREARDLLRRGGKEGSLLRNSGLSANFLIAFRVSWLWNRFEFVFRP